MAHLHSILSRRSSRHTGGDFNLYGLDPEGKKTHLVNHMYGLWQLPTVHQPRFSGKSQAPPRYGPPSAEQIPWLPTSFVQRHPPMYYGVPSPPFLPPPVYFDLIVFHELISRPSGRQLHAQVADLPLVQITYGVWFVPIIYTTDLHSQVHEFHISTSVPWEDFKSVARTYLQLRSSGGRLGCRVRRNGSPQELHALRNATDWLKVIRKLVLAAEKNIGGELMIFNLDTIPGLSSKIPDIITFPFDYPTVERLLQLIDSAGETGGDIPLIDSKGRQGLRIAGVFFMDDFMLLSPVDLSLISQVTPEKTIVLYDAAMKMIEQVHEENKEDVESITYIRKLIN